MVEALILPLHNQISYARLESAWCTKQCGTPSTSIYIPY